MPKPGHAILVIGPSGSGKSSFARDALLEEGSGLIALAPGVDEVASYAEFGGEEGYSTESFASPSKAVAWLEEVYRKNFEHYQKNGTALHKLLITDTLSGYDQIIRGAVTKKMGIIEPPKAQSPAGYDFYTGIQYRWERILAPCRALRGLGVHWIALSHTKTRAADEETMKSSGLESVELVQPLVTGATRNSLPGAFDLVMHSSIEYVKQEIVFALRCKGDPTKVTKSRFGDLAEGAMVKNYWKPVVELIDKAIAKRKEEFNKRRLK